jgi:hypothetical protein
MMAHPSSLCSGASCRTQSAVVLLETGALRVLRGIR